MKIYTIGHSTRALDEFLEILKHYKIKQVVDVRHYPYSRKFPWFSKDALAESLREEGIKYVWMEGLGGFRRGGYLAHMETEEWISAFEQLKELAQNGKGEGKVKVKRKTEKTAVMCAEVLWFKCHRRYIADRLMKEGYSVINIYDIKRAEEHNPTEKTDVKPKCQKPKFMRRIEKLEHYTCHLGTQGLNKFKDKVQG